MVGTMQLILQGMNKDLKTLNMTKVKNYLRNLNSIIQKAPSQAKIGYYCIIAGIFLLLLQIVLLVF